MRFQIKFLLYPAIFLGLLPVVGQFPEVVTGADGGFYTESAIGFPEGIKSISEGRFVVFMRADDERLASSILNAALKNDSFPGLPRPSKRVVIAIAPDENLFRSWAGPSAPHWGSAVAFPSRQQVVMRGSGIPGLTGNPLVTLRHELAHLALAEYLGDLAPRWFDEGYAAYSAGEWDRERALSTSIGLALRGVPTLESLELMFYRGSDQASLAYALSYRAVSDLSQIGGDFGLSAFFDKWKSTGSFERALRLAYGISSHDFEQQWRKNTRRRYGALALVANLSLATGFFTLLLGPLFVQKKRRNRVRIEKMRVSEAMEEQMLRLSIQRALLEAQRYGAQEPEEEQKKPQKSEDSAL